MCGICGVLGLAEAGAITEAMNARLRHRGPDHQAVYRDGDLALGISRLAILDVASGNQPLFSDDEQIVVVHNGEIYNFEALREELQAKGYRFRTGTDTEVLVHGYQAWGLDLIGRLRGMFASAIFDRKRRRLLVARDRFGEKPLFFSRQGDGLVFSSELKSLLAFEGLERRARADALGMFLRVGFVPEPMSAFAGIESLPPGSYLTVEDGRIEVRTYARPTFQVDHALEDDEAAKQACRQALDNAVKRQMVSDVPLGAFLSGGIDSSAVVSSMVATSSSPVKTFTVRFEDQAYDESALARKTAEHLGTEHHEIVVPNASFDEDDLWRIVDHVGQPFYDSSAIPTYLLCAQVRKHVTVALTGDGGDEMFAGYPFFRWAQRVQQLGWLPDGVLQGGAQMSRKLAQLPLLQERGELRQARRALEAAIGPRTGIPARVLSVFDPGEVDALVVDPAMNRAGVGELEALTALPAEADCWSPLRRLMFYRLKNNLARDMLTKIDSMSMACSLELRAPMLDVEVAEVASRMPDRQLLRDGVGKWVLREAVRSRLPAEVFTKPKSGFSVPLHHYMNERFHALAAELLAPSGPVGELFDQAEVTRIRERARDVLADRADVSVYRASHQLWSLVVLAAWAQRFGVTF